MMNTRQPGGSVAVLIAIAIAVTVSWAQSARAGQIRLWPAATVSDEAVRLADIAELQAFDPSTTIRLGGLVVHAAPRPGGEVLVRLNDVRSTLAQADANLASIRIYGSSRCKVSRPRTPQAPRAIVERPKKKRARALAKVGSRTARFARLARTTVRTGSLESILGEYIGARVADLGGRLEIRFSPANRDDLSLTQPDYQFEIRPRDDRRIGLLSFEVDVMKAGRHERTVPVVAEVWLVKEVVVARRAINRGQKMQARDVRLERRRFRDVESVGVTDVPAVVGRQCARFIKPGEMLLPQWVRESPLVRRGEKVTVWSRRGGVVVKTTGTAQQAGFLGSVIEVRRDGTRRKQDLIEAVVSGPGTVTISGVRRVASR